MLLRSSLARTLCCPHCPQATLSALVVLGLIPLQLAPVLAWMMLGQVVPKPKRSTACSRYSGFRQSQILLPRASRNHSDRSRWSLTEGVMRERSLCGLNLPKMAGGRLFKCPCGPALGGSKRPDQWGEGAHIDRVLSGSHTHSTPPAKGLLE